MTILIALYLTALSLSIGFFLLAVYSFAAARRRSARRLVVDLGPDSEPAIVALYCQYLVAPQLALREAQLALAATPARRTALHGPPITDFFEALDLLQARSPASLR